MRCKNAFDGVGQRIDVTRRHDKSVVPSSHHILCAHVLCDDNGYAARQRLAYHEAESILNRGQHQQRTVLIEANERSSVERSGVSESSLIATKNGNHLPSDGSRKYQFSIGRCQSSPSFKKIYVPLNRGYFSDAHNSKRLGTGWMWCGDIRPKVGGKLYDFNILGRKPRFNKGVANQC